MSATSLNNIDVTRELILGLGTGAAAMLIMKFGFKAEFPWPAFAVVGGSAIVGDIAAPYVQKMIGVGQPSTPSVTARLASANAAAALSPVSRNSW